MRTAVTIVAKQDRMIKTFSKSYIFTAWALRTVTSLALYFLLAAMGNPSVKKGSSDLFWIPSSTDAQGVPQTDALLWWFYR